MFFDSARTSLYYCPPNLSTHWLLEMRRVEQDTHEHTGDGACNRDRHDPGDDKQAHTLPVHCLVGAVAETYTNSGTGNAHGGRDWQRELREQKHGDSSAHLHGTTWR